VAQLVEALRYKQEGRELDSRLGHWEFSLASSFRPQHGLQQKSSLGGKVGRWVGQKTLTLICANSSQIWKSQPPGSLRSSPVLILDSFILIHLITSEQICPLRVEFRYLYSR
jgi:hypothetical protein